jgi:alpha-L-arabinofuranosidase
MTRNFVEYVSGPTGFWGDLRKKNGRADPFDVKHWCLGNEMDGPWQSVTRQRRIWPARQRTPKPCAPSTKTCN